MKGMIFTEFLDMLESQFGLGFVDQIIREAGIQSGGAYTSVGHYDHNELIKLMEVAATKSQNTSAQLMYQYGKFLFVRLQESYPQYFERTKSAFDFFQNLLETVHTEVRTLYPNAEIPNFVTIEESPTRMKLIYRSKRPLADLAAGLVQGCVDHFEKPMTIERVDHKTVIGAHSEFIMELQ